MIPILNLIIQFPHSCNILMDWCGSSLQIQESQRMETSVIARGHFRLIILFLYILGSHTVLAAESDEFTELDTQQLVARLQQGGLIIYFRHAATDQTQEDQHPVVLDKCKTQRNLSAEGKSQMANAGAAFKRLSIPVDEVFSSPFCRCKDTAKIAFGKYTINTDLYFSVALEKEQRDQQTRSLQILLRTQPESGNRVIVSHTANLREATGLWPKPEGVAYIFEPTNNDSHHLLGIIKPDKWEQL